MSYSGKYCIRVEPQDNGFTVEVPDMKAIKAKEAADAKNKNTGSYPSTYIGDLTECYIAKSVAEVLKLVKRALSEIPEPDMEYAQAFSDATKLTADND